MLWIIHAEWKQNTKRNCDENKFVAVDCQVQYLELKISSLVYVSDRNGSWVFRPSDHRISNFTGSGRTMGQPHWSLVCDGTLYWPADSRHTHRYVSRHVVTDPVQFVIKRASWSGYKGDDFSPLTRFSDIVINESQNFRNYRLSRWLGSGR